MQSINLTNQFLVAMPGLRDSGFEKAVAYVCAHSEQGAMGIVINKPLDIELGQIFQQMDIPSSDPEACNKIIFQGGPVHTDRGFILHHGTREWDSSIRISKEVCVTTSKGLLEAMAAGEGPEEALVALGYAGWSSGQLEQEMMDNIWLNIPVDPSIIFNTPFEECWTAVASHIGINIEQLSSDIGHA